MIRKSRSSLSNLKDPMSAYRFFTNRIIAGTLVTAALTFAMPAGAQVAVPTTAPAGPHTILVKLVALPGSKPFGFEPGTLTAQRGDTIRFEEAAAALHNVHFKAWPKGAKLGGAATSPYLTALGQSYTVVIDSRFPNGQYEVVCDPHELIGMHLMLTVTGATPSSRGKQ